MLSGSTFFSFGTLALLALIILVAIALYKSIVIISQGEKGIIERLGKYSRCLSPGLHVTVPFVESVRYRVTSRDVVLDIPKQEVISKDNVVIEANAVAYFNIAIPEKAVYGVEDFQRAVSTLVQTTLRAILGGMDFDEALSSREKIRAQLKAEIAETLLDWGITLRSVEVQDIRPSKTMQESMERQAASERERRAAIALAEGRKQSVILESEGRLEAAERDASAQIKMAEATKRAVELVREGMGDKELPALYLLGEKYVHSMEKMANSNNAKTIVIPGDILQAAKSILGKY